MRRLLEKLAALLRGRNRGTVTLGFALVFPILLLLIGILVQYALLANAQLTLDRAVQAGARSAMTSLPTDQAIGDAGGPDNVYRSIRMTLEALSPAPPDDTNSEIFVSSEAQTVADALQQLGQTLPNRYTERYTFAQNATTITIDPIDGSGGNYAQDRSPRVRLTVTYDFQITIPVINMIGRRDTVSGVTGRFRRLTSTLDVQLSPGREGQ